MFYTLVERSYSFIGWGFHLTTVKTEAKTKKVCLFFMLEGFQVLRLTLSQWSCIGRTRLRLFLNLLENSAKFHFQNKPFWCGEFVQRPNQQKYK